ncbi:MAG: hypothetical protein O7F74_07025 [Bacteroidetes bacterium]|nr:hypothetical protein [Bacteroidota bacterium]
MSSMVFSNQYISVYRCGGVYRDECTGWRGVIGWVLGRGEPAETT